MSQPEKTTSILTNKLLNRITHELAMPINTLAAGCDRLLYLAKADERIYDLAEDMLSWCQLAKHILEQSAWLSVESTDDLRLDCDRVSVMADVIAPLKPVMSKLLDDRGFDVKRITYGKIDSIPFLYLDRNQFQMVFFNLFSNAIKYAFSDPNRFRIEITAELKGGEYRIHFQDWGPGIDRAYQETIFDHGMRGPASLNQLVKGMGLGLWVVRRVVEAHEGRVTVTKESDPTTITIFLPEARRSSSPPRAKKN